MEDNSAGLPATSCNSGTPTSGPTTNPTGGGGGHHHHHPTTSNPFTPLFVAGGPLAFTGVSAQGPLVIAGALVALGIFLLIARRKRKKADQS
jgi:LPXTG-motif cell wall-anchored protein